MYECVSAYNLSITLLYKTKCIFELVYEYLLQLLVHNYVQATKYSEEICFGEITYGLHYTYTLALIHLTMILYLKNSSHEAVTATGTSLTELWNDVWIQI